MNKSLYTVSVRSWLLAA